MKFKSRKDVFSPLIVFGFAILFLWIVWDLLTKTSSEKKDLFGLLAIFAVSVLLFWIYFGTYYELTEKDLKYRSGPLYGKIDISLIHEVVKNKTLWGGLKPALARKGLIIKYDKYNEIYISPKTNNTFIRKLVELNPNIKISE